MQTFIDWIDEAHSNREKLSLILAAVHRCYMECPGQERSGPHMSISMAFEYISQMLQED